MAMVFFEIEDSAHPPFWMIWPAILICHWDCRQCSYLSFQRIDCPPGCCDLGYSCFVNAIVKSGRSWLFHGFSPRQRRAWALVGPLPALVY